MSATIPNGTTHRLSTTSLTGLSCGNSLLVMAWLRRANVDPTVSVAWALELNESGGSNTEPHARLMTLFSGTLLDRGRINTGGSAGNQATTLGTWTHFALWYGGWTGTSQLVRLYRNGVFGGDGSLASSFPAASLAALTLFDRVGGSGGGHWRGHIAEVAIFSNISTGQRDTIVAEAQTRHVGALTIVPNFSWRLLSNANATVGGVNLTATGSVTYDSTIHPPVGDGSGGGGAVLRATMIGL